MNSQKFQISEQDSLKWLKNIGIFATPLVILFLTALSQGVPLQQAVYLLYGAILNALIDLLRKWYSGPHFDIPPLPTNTEGKVVTPPANP